MGKERQGWRSAVKKGAGKKKEAGVWELRGPRKSTGERVIHRGAGGEGLMCVP